MVELLIAQTAAEAFQYSEWRRKILPVLRNGRADFIQMTDEERRQEKQLNATMTALGSQLRKESSLPHPDKARLAGIEARLQTARLDYEAHETRVYAAHPDLKVNRGDVDPITVGEAGQVIHNSGTAILEYVVAPEKHTCSS